MRISRLRLSGFKSFVEPATLHIEPGLTGIVGPNGCGKSNLLEAFRWVMGENSPKSMRGGGMEDVIFAGTSRRPPRDFAEVLLIGEGADGAELEVVRRIERGAGSAYRINGHDVRAKDVALIFADAATGAHSPALVSQGRIAAVIAARPAERRQMLEEAAGIAGLHVRRHDAEIRLKQTEANLDRLRQLLGGLEGQIASLRRQARQAERYRTLSDDIRRAEARLVFARWRQAADATKEAKAQAEQAERAVEAARAANAEAQARQRAAMQHLAMLRATLAERRDAAHAHAHRMEALEGKLAAAKQRLADFDRQRDQLERDRAEADRTTREASDALARLNGELAQAKESLAQSTATTPELARAVEEAEQAARTDELALAQVTAQHAQTAADWRVAQVSLAHAQTRLARLREEGARREQQLAALVPASALNEAVVEARAASEAAERRLREAQDTLREVLERQDSLQARSAAAAAALSAARADLAGIEREWQALSREREQRQANGAGSALRALDRIAVSPGYERALAAVLRGDGAAPLGARTGEGARWSGDAPEVETVADSLLHRLTACPGELRARFALVHLAEEDDGRTLHPGHWLVTTGGVLRRWDGFVASGEGQADAARLEEANRFAALDTRLPGLRQAVDIAAKTDAEASRALAAVQRERIAAERTLADAATAERAALKAFDQAEVARERQAERLAEHRSAAVDQQNREMEAEAELAEASAMLSRLTDPAEGAAEVEAARARSWEARRRHQAAIAALATHEQALAVLRERAVARRSDIANWTARSGEAARRLEDMAGRLEQIAADRAVEAARPAAFARDIAEGVEVTVEADAALNDAVVVCDEGERAAGEAERALAATTETLSAARETRATLLAQAESQELRRVEMTRISGERFQVPPPLLPGRFSFYEEEVRGTEAESAELDRLNGARERLGPVNLVAAEELARLEEEHGAGARDAEELAEAVNRLRGSIGSLNREGRERLREAFTAVDDHFRQLFTRLFEGGQAHLALVDSDDPLEAGLEIYAQPPGKRLQSLTLLSGGEQALTAIALIFALFLTSPAPICVLDEVDAPLDDANIDRFCALLDSMARDTATRYLIVTHNAVTMSRMHRLFGVTMVEPGVSRLVSVDLGGAEELLAAE